MKSQIFYPKRSTIFQAIRIAAIVGFAILGVVLILFMALFGVFRLVAMDSQNRIEQRYPDVFAMAKELGYTPNRLLLQTQSDAGSSLFIIDMGTTCYTHLYFTTPLTIEQVNRRINALSPELRHRIRVQDEPPYDRFDIPATVQVAESKQAQALWHDAVKTTYWWSSLDYPVDVHYYDVLNLPVTLEHKGRPIHDNIVEVAGEISVPGWIACMHLEIEP